MQSMKGRNNGCGAGQRGKGRYAVRAQGGRRRRLCIYTPIGRKVNATAARRRMEAFVCIYYAKEYATARMCGEGGGEVVLQCSRGRRPNLARARTHAATLLLA
jgi:hypothetical protein